MSDLPTDPTAIESTHDQEKVLSLLKKADQHYRQGHRLRAIWYYKKALNRHPESVTGLVNLGLIYSTQKRKHGKALQLLHKAYLLAPENPTLLLNLATLTSQQGEHREAMGYLLKTEKIRPDYPDLHYNKAHLLAQDNKYKEALSEINRELELKPQNLNALIMQKILEEKLKD